jgi:plastocyanin
MNARTARVGIAATALAVALGLFVVLASTDDVATEPATAQSHSAQTATATHEEPKPPVRRIVVRDGKPAGGVARLEYKSGERVRFSVHADAAHEVHVHGFDIEKDVPAKGAARFEFRADIEGVFEVELHEGHVTIAELRIRP